MATVEQEITDLLARLRLAREVGEQHTVEEAERQMDYLLEQRALEQQSQARG